MVFSNTLLATSALVMAAFTTVNAIIAPSYPSPGTIWTEGTAYEILWGDDGQSPSITTDWTNFTIDFMTGDNLSQKRLTTVATGLNGATSTSYKWTAPTVNPHSAIYFFMFTNGKDGSAWTTRFGIVSANSTLVAPSNPTQPDGSKIPWGVGSLVGAAPASAPAPASSVSASTSAAAISASASSIVAAAPASSSAAAPVVTVSSGILPPPLASVPVFSSSSSAAIVPSATPSSGSNTSSAASTSSSAGITSQQSVSSQSRSNSAGSFVKPATGVAAIAMMAGFLMNL